MLIQNDLGEFVDQYDPNPDEMRARNYAGLRALKPSDCREEEPTRKPPSKWAGMGTERTCPICGETFGARSKQHKYCSPECARQGKAVIRRRSYEKKLYEKAKAERRDR